MVSNEKKDEPPPVLSIQSKGQGSEHEQGFVEECIFMSVQRERACIKSVGVPFQVFLALILVYFLIIKHRGKPHMPSVLKAPNPRLKANEG